MKFHPDQVVKTCPKLEAGLRFGPEGIRACQLGPFAAPLYFTALEAGSREITKDMIIQKRKDLFEQLNDSHSDIICKKCEMVEMKPFKEVVFTKLGRIDHSPRTICNLRCDYCGFTAAEKAGDVENGFVESSYESLKILNEFQKEDVLWDSAVDFNGGETSLIKNLNEYLQYFTRMKIRVLLFTNGVIFKPEIYENIENGTIDWAVISLDCGTPSTYKRMKKADAYGKVLESITKYAHAGAKGKGRLAVKYIFTESNCSDDDIFGFAYSILAVRPQKIWLTFDFTPFSVIPPDSQDFGTFTFDKQISAYAKLYHLLKMHGQDVVHYTEGHLAKISKPGKLLLDMVKKKISRDRIGRDGQVADSLMKLEDFRNKIDAPAKFTKIAIHKDHIKNRHTGEIIDFSGKRVAFAPATERTLDLIKCNLLSQSKIVGLCDRNKNLHTKIVQGHQVYAYENLPEIDYIFVAAPEQHKDEILSTVFNAIADENKILVCE